MDDVLTVIFGAGASHDCVTSHNRRPNVQSHIPLTDGLFDTPYFNILDKYPGARGIGQFFKRRVNHGGHITLEEYLRERLAETDDKELQVNIRQMPSYLRELIGTAGNETLQEQGTTGYEDLIDHLAKSSYKTIALITLNWDLLLDRALQNRVHMKIINHDMGAYLDHRGRWNYIKFHGSVNWVKKIPVTQVIQVGDPLRGIASLEPSSELVKGARVEFVDELGFYDNDYYFLPVMVLPHDQKKSYICDESHYEALKTLLPRSSDLWIIGSSMVDADILKLLKSYAIRVQHVTLVNYFRDQKGEQAESYFERIRSLFPNAGFVKRYHGFRHFVEELS